MIIKIFQLRKALQLFKTVPFIKITFVLKTKWNLKSSKKKVKFLKACQVERTTLIVLIHILPDAS